MPIYTANNEAVIEITVHISALSKCKVAVFVLWATGAVKLVVAKQLFICEVLFQGVCQGAAILWDRHFQAAKALISVGASVAKGAGSCTACCASKDIVYDAVILQNMKHDLQSPDNRGHAEPTVITGCM